MLANRLEFGTVFSDCISDKDNSELPSLQLSTSTTQACKSHFVQNSVQAGTVSADRTNHQNMAGDGIKFDHISSILPEFLSDEFPMNLDLDTIQLEPLGRINESHTIIDDLKPDTVNSLNGWSCPSKSPISAFANNQKPHRERQLTETSDTGSGLGCNLRPLVDSMVFLTDEVLMGQNLSIDSLFESLSPTRKKQVSGYLGHSANDNAGADALGISDSSPVHQSASSVVSHVHTQAEYKDSDPDMAASSGTSLTWVTLFWNTFPALKLNGESYVRLVDISRQALTNKGPSTLKGRCDRLGIKVKQLDELQRKRLVKYGCSFPSRNSHIISETCAKQLIASYLSPAELKHFERTAERDRRAAERKLRQKGPQAEQPAMASKFACDVDAILRNSSGRRQTRGKRINFNEMVGRKGDGGQLPSGSTKTSAKWTWDDKQHEQLWAGGAGSRLSSSDARSLITAGAALSFDRDRDRDRTRVKIEPSSLEEPLHTTDAQQSALESAQSEFVPETRTSAPSSSFSHFPNSSSEPLATFAAGRMPRGARAKYSSQGLSSRGRGRRPRLRKSRSTEPAAAARQYNNDVSKNSLVDMHSDAKQHIACELESIDDVPTEPEASISAVDFPQNNFLQLLQTSLPELAPLDTSHNSDGFLASEGEPPDATDRTDAAEAAPADATCGTEGTTGPVLLTPVVDQHNYCVIRVAAAVAVGTNEATEGARSVGVATVAASVVEPTNDGTGAGAKRRGWRTGRGGGIVGSGAGGSRQPRRGPRSDTTDSPSALERHTAAHSPAVAADTRALHVEHRAVMPSSDPRLILAHHISQRGHLYLHLYRSITAQCVVCADCSQRFSVAAFLQHLHLDGQVFNADVIETGTREFALPVAADQTEYGAPFENENSRQQQNLWSRFQSLRQCYILTQNMADQTNQMYRTKYAKAALAEIGRLSKQMVKGGIDEMETIGNSVEGVPTYTALPGLAGIASLGGMGRGRGRRRLDMTNREDVAGNVGYTASAEGDGVGSWRGPLLLGPRNVGSISGVGGGSSSSNTSNSSVAGSLGVATAGSPPLSALHSGGAQRVASDPPGDLRSTAAARIRRSPRRYPPRLQSAASASVGDRPSPMLLPSFSDPGSRKRSRRGRTSYFFNIDDLFKSDQHC